MTYTCATMVYPNAKGLLDFIQSKFAIRPSKFRIIGRGSSNGIDSDFFSKSVELVAEAHQIRLRHGIPDDALVFSFVGRVVKDKGIGELLQAFKHIQAIHPNVFLVIVGPLEQELDPLDADEIHFMQHNPHVIIAGFQNDVRPWLLASTVFVFPSYREGFPNVVLQASCLEIPCIVSDINGCNEIIQHAVTGLIVPPKDAHALEKAMVQLMNEPDLRERFGKKAREYVTANFDQHYVWHELLQEYKRLTKAVN